MYLFRVHFYLLSEKFENYLKTSFWKNKTKKFTIILDNHFERVQRVLKNKQLSKWQH